MLAARAAVRSEVVPGAAPEQPEPIQVRLAFDGDATPFERELKPEPRHPWAWLLARVFAVDVMTCSRCGGRMRLVEIADSRDDIARVLATSASGHGHHRVRSRLGRLRACRTTRTLLHLA